LTVDPSLPLKVIDETDMFNPTSQSRCIAAGFLFVAVVVLPVRGDDPPKSSASIIGRWDLVVKGSRGDYPSWLEVRKSGYRTLVGSFVGRTGSARPIGRVEFADGHVRFSVPIQWEFRNGDLVLEGQVQGDTLQGETTDDQGQRVSWTGRRAPSLRRERSPHWGKPIELFNGKDLDGWKPRPPAEKSAWTVQDGLLVNAKSGTDLISKQTFEDFRVQAEFRYPAKSNSGIYLRGRYEVQIEDNYGDEPDVHKIGGVYGFLIPRINAARKPGEWQTLDISLVGRVVTVVLNGETVIDRQTIPGITGGALDSDEGAPGPLLIQGDHGPIEFRRLTLTPAE
jgi:hypothetical protein